MFTCSIAVCKKASLHKIQWQRSSLPRLPWPPIDTPRWILSPAVQKRMEHMLQRHQEIIKEMNSAGNTSQDLSRELYSMSKAVKLFENLKQINDEEQSIKSLTEEASEVNDIDLVNECEQELINLKKRITITETKIVDAVLPDDQDDYESEAIIEIRAGTGGDEASLFASELIEAYIKTAKSIGWRTEILSQGKSEIGGIRDTCLAVNGSAITLSPSIVSGDTTSETVLGPYGFFKFESGVHRVQRVPINDSKIHTSACSVAVLPGVSSTMASQDILPPSELKIDTMRASGAGGQHVNTTDSAVRITHIPTGITVSIQDERSQQQNRKKAITIIAARVRDKLKADKEKARGETRSNLMGGGDRSERIRTYNYPQDRVTDHRCKESRNGIVNLFSGGEQTLVGTFLPYLKALHREELLTKLEEEVAKK